MRKSGKRKISAGTVAVLLMTMAILGGTVFVWLRLSSGKTVDLSRLKPEETGDTSPEEGDRHD